MRDKNFTNEQEASTCKLDLSIIIPTLNEADSIQDLIRFLQAETVGKAVEIIVADAQSRDQTAEFAKECGVKVISCNQRSRAHQMNKGAELACGSILWFVHADTKPPTGFFLDIQQAVLKGADLGSYRFKFDSRKPLLKINSWFTRFNFLTFRGGDQTLFITRKAFDELNGFNEQFSIMEEYDLLKRASENHTFQLLPKSVLVSARKYDHNGYLTVNLANLKAMRMFNKGVHPDKIKAYYFEAINHPKA